ncbi:MAG: hypothetical protein V3U87_09835, partial [Methylococcaceae bacterium]
TQKMKILNNWLVIGVLFCSTANSDSNYDINSRTLSIPAVKVDNLYYAADLLLDGNQTLVLENAELTTKSGTNPAVFDLLKNQVTIPRIFVSGSDVDYTAIIGLINNNPIEFNILSLDTIVRLNQTKIDYFKARTPDRDDEFGHAVALSGDGNTLIVGSPLEDSGSKNINGDEQDNSEIESGAVYVFEKDQNGIWRQTAYIKASNTDSFDHFGKSLDISDDGNIFVVGAPKESSGSTGIDSDQGNDHSHNGIRSGAVYVFIRNNDNKWHQMSYIKASNTDSDDGFGYSIAFSGDGKTLAVGAPGEDSGATQVNGEQEDTFPLAGGASGAAYLFVLTGDSWKQQAYIKGSKLQSFASFGTSVDLSVDGSTLVVGSPRHHSPPENEEMNLKFDESGAAYVFQRNNNDWTEEAFLRASNAEGLDRYGISIAVSGDGKTIAVGADTEDGGDTGINGNEEEEEPFGLGQIGAVYTYSKEGQKWIQDAYIKPAIIEPRDRFGNDLCLSNDGSRLVIAASSESSSATGINGIDDNNSESKGAAYVFVRDEQTVWHQESYIKSPYLHSLFFANSIDIDSSGFNIAVGEKLESGAGTGVNNIRPDQRGFNTGAAFIFELE